jgi:ATP-dependent protease ClpP protease subunit
MTLINKNDILNNFHDYSSDIKTREIFLHNYYDHDGNQGVEYRMANVFLKNLRALELSSNKPILIHLNSLGGEWNDCMAIYDALYFSQSNTIMVSYGQTESCSTIILQAATTRILMPSAYFMVHYGYSGISSSFLNAQNWNKYEKYLCDYMMEIYADRCINGKFFKEKNYTIDQVKKYFYKKFKDGDWYMTSDEAVYYGFADGILGTKKYPNINSLTIE